MSLLTWFPGLARPTLHARLTRRYVVAIGIVTCVITVSHLVALGYARAGAEDGTLINEAGRQRYLSQTIALLTGGLAAATARGDTEALDQYAPALATAIDRMQANHDRLASAPLGGGSERAKLTDPDALYFGEGALHERIQAYLDGSREILAAHRAGTLDPVATRPMIRAMVSEALGPLLDDLDDVVTNYEAAFRVDRNNATRISLGLLLVAFAVIAFEILYVFRPMVATVVSAVEELEASNARLKRFVYLLSHDLRAPIASAQGLMGLVDEALEEGDVDDAREMCTVVLGSLSRVDALIDSLTELVRTDGHVEAPSGVDLARLVRRSRGAMQGLEGRDEVRIGIVDRLSGPVGVPVAQVRSILDNLIGNGIKYRRRTEGLVGVVPVHPFVEVTLSRVSPRRIQVTVADNGLGIPPEHRSELFGAFKRFHPRTAAGSGLGLHLVRACATAMGGEVAYAPRPGGGSVFTVQIPDSGPEAGVS